MCIFLIPSEARDHLGPYLEMGMAALVVESGDQEASHATMPEAMVPIVFNWSDISGGLESVYPLGAVVGRNGPTIVIARMRCRCDVVAQCCQFRTSKVLPIDRRLSA